MAILKAAVASAGVSNPAKSFYSTLKNELKEICEECTESYDREFANEAFR